MAKNTAPPSVPVEERPFQVPDNWRWVRLNTVCAFEHGITFPKDAKESSPRTGNLPCLRTANVQESLTLDNLIYIDESALKQNQNKLVRKDDIIFSSANSRELVGKSVYIDHLPFPMTFGGFVLNIRSQPLIVSKFLFWFLRYEFLTGGFFSRATQTTNIANINTKILGNYAFPLPPLPEQRRIVERIENLFAGLDEARDKAQAVLDGYEYRRAAILHKAFTGELTAKWRAQHGIGLDSWKHCLYGELGESKLGKMLDAKKNVGQPVKYLRNINVRWFGFDMTDIHSMLASKDEIKNLHVKKGDLFICEGGEPGRCAVWNGADMENLIFQKALHRFRPNSNVNSDLVAYYIFYISLNGTLGQFFTGSTIKHLTGKALSKIPIFLPSFDEQREIVRILDKILTKERHTKQSAERVLESVGLIKKAVLGRAFRGLLGTNDPTEGALS